VFSSLLSAFTRKCCLDVSGSFISFFVFNSIFIVSQKRLSGDYFTPEKLKGDNKQYKPCKYTSLSILNKRRAETLSSGIKPASGLIIGHRTNDRSSRSIERSLGVHVLLSSVELFGKGLGPAKRPRFVKFFFYWLRWKQKRLTIKYWFYCTIYIHTCVWT